jgi:myo-inositol-1(or 4)-monophosphatase
MRSDNDNITAITDFGTEVMSQAGDIALRYFRTELEVINKAKKRKYDPVTLADREVETFLRTRIHETWPDHGIVGEEYGEEEARQGDRAWLIDPIDGTRGFVSGTPMWGLLLGLTEGGRPLAGFMRQPYLGETYVGSPLGGKLLTAGGSVPLATSRTEDLKDAILCCTHPTMFRSEKDRAVFWEVEAATRFSRLGTDCYGYGLLARGFVDLIVEGDLERYDILPLVPIVEAAGGVVTDWEGNPPLSGGNVVAAANPKLHAAALEVIRRAL